MADAVEARRVPLDSTLTPEQAVLLLRGDERPFALVGDWLSGLCVLGSSPTDPVAQESVAGDVLVGGGWIGWLGYRLGSLIEDLPAGPPSRVPRPRDSVAYYDHVIVFDGTQWWFEMLWTAERDAVLASRLGIWRERMSGSRAAGPVGPAPGPFAITGDGPAGHVAAVIDCVERIAAGELFQANICLRLEASFGGDPLDLFAAALPVAAPRFGAFIDGVVSLSPERFLRRVGRSVWTEPIKGTRPRVAGADVEMARLELEASAKDAAEHVMIVDLMRNDLGRVCEYGSIVAEPARIEPHAGVWHLVSTVRGQLRPDVSDLELMRATFPPGSVTGAPKVQAMKVIAALESSAREAYTGAIGISSPIAGLDLSVAIRTFEVGDGRIWLGAGGGIVADSDPGAELEEALAKAAGPLAAIGADPVSAPRQRVFGGRPPRASAEDPSTGQPQRALTFGDRPDAALGVFETVLVERGAAVWAEAHLARLTASVSSLYGVTLPADLGEQVDAAATGVTRGRLRVLVGADGSVEVTVADEPPAATAIVELVPYVLPGGLGRHKWQDRRLLEALALERPGTVPLLVGGDGLVLEAGHANVWLRRGGDLLTPPADGRILPGVTRGALLAALPGARECALTLADLAAADQVFLSSAISGRRRAGLRQ